ncbi:MAG: class I SAM-dependent methyltransferase [Zetaproteobacteria bacterium]|nr:MAG: class I SAM-dependent methyltransferase [Zetaproteobacteria bacterium]
MAQVTHGIRAILSSPLFYSLFQRLVGAERFRRLFVERELPKGKGMRLLDIGCGPADLLAHLPDDWSYFGFDASGAYIEQARRRFGSRGHFQARLLDEAVIDELEGFDVVLAIGLLHHLDDAQAVRLFRLAWQALKPGGICITVDPVWHEHQHALARWIIARDRGQNVRDECSYRRLAMQVFDRVNSHVHQDMMLIPYSHLIMRASKPQASS